MVVILRGAAAVDGFAIGSAYNVHLAGVRELLQVPVNRGQADRNALVPELVVQLLRAAESLGGAERVPYRISLAGHNATRVTAYITATPATVDSSVSLPGCRACASGRMSLVARYNSTPAKKPR